MTQTFRALWAWTFNAFPGVSPGKGWGEFPDGASLQLPGNKTAELHSLFLMKPRKLRVQLPLGTAAGDFPALVTIHGPAGDASYAAPGNRQTTKLAEVRDYVFSGGQPPAKLVDMETEVSLLWDQVPTAETEPEPLPESGPLPVIQVAHYDAGTHALLYDIAHTELLTPAEYPDLERRVRGLGAEVVQVQLPEWPRVPYSPLALVSSADGGTVGAPWWEGRFWSGSQPAVLLSQRLDYTYPERPDIAAALAPGMAGVEHSVRADTVARYEGRLLAGDRFDGLRLAYREQVAVYEADTHVLVKPWLRAQGLDVPGFYRDWIPELVGKLGFNPVIETTNPAAREEHESLGYYSPTADAVVTVHEEAVLGGYAASVSGRRMPPLVIDEAPAQAPPPTPPTPPSRPAAVVEGSRAYSVRDAAQALRNAFGFMPPLFGNAAADSAIVAMTREGLASYLAWSDLDRQAYVADTGGRNFVCDDFALSFKSDAARYFGMNNVGVVWGNVHAWCFVFVVGKGERPDVVFIEPQVDDVRDAEIGNFRGAYAIDRRCAVLL